MRLNPLTATFDSPSVFHGIAAHFKHIIRTPNPEDRLSGIFLKTMPQDQLAPFRVKGRRIINLQDHVVGQIPIGVALE